MNPKHLFKRFCHDCDTSYQPIGKNQKYCLSCQKKRRNELTQRLKRERLRKQ